MTVYLLLSTIDNRIQWQDQALALRECQDLWDNQWAVRWAVPQDRTAAQDQWVLQDKGSQDLWAIRWEVPQEGSPALDLAVNHLIWDVLEVLLLAVNLVPTARLLTRARETCSATTLFRSSREEGKQPLQRQRRAGGWTWQRGLPGA